jgi:hypothetical protein
MTSSENISSSSKLLFAKLIHPAGEVDKYSFSNLDNLVLFNKEGDVMVQRRLRV